MHDSGGLFHHILHNIPCGRICLVLVTAKSFTNVQGTLIHIGMNAVICKKIGSHCGGMVRNAALGEWPFNVVTYYVHATRPTVLRPIGNAHTPYPMFFVWYTKF